MATIEHQTTTTYFEHRMAELGIHPDDAHHHGLREDEHGNILQTIRTFAGKPILWVDKSGRNRRKIATIKNRRSIGDTGGLEQFNRELSILRYSPENLERRRRTKPDTGKYRFPSKDVTGHGVYPMPTNAAIDAHNAGKTGGVAVGIEGYFKAVALAVNGVEATAFTGITTYKVCPDMAEYFLRRRLDDFIIMYDADAVEVRTKEDAGVVDGRRVFMFYNSAKHFAEAFHDFCKEHNLHTRLHFCMVNPEAGEKGVDDLLATSTPEVREQILADIHGMADGPHFHFLRLGRTTYDQELKNFFGTSNHVSFYRRHSSIIQKKPFRFDGLTYQLIIPPRHFDLFESRAGHRYFRVLDDPFRVDMEVEELRVERYMAEVAAQLDKVIQDNDRVAIDAPTGVGKTSFFLGHRERGRRIPGYFQRTRRAGVVAVPTVNLAKQLAVEHRVPALYGYVTARDKQKAMLSEVMVCTYDCLRHVEDIERRVVVVDEAHNLVNQYGEVRTRRPFRAPVLRHMVEQFRRAERSILISGTAPKLLAKHLGFHYVAIQRRQNNRVNVYAIQAEKQSNKAYTAAALAELGRIDFTTDNRLHFVFFNNTAELEKIKAHMVASGKVDEKDVAIITREHVNAGHPVFSELIKKQKITGAKLVLTTCLIAEGININNCNIGNIYTVAVNCPDLFRQFVARFRKMEVVDVYDIRPPERSVHPSFRRPADDEVAYLAEVAALQAKYLEVENRRAMLDYTTAELEFLEDIRPGYRYESDIYDWVYTTEDARVEVDYLRIFAHVRERMMAGLNNCYFYTQIGRHPNIILQGAEELTNQQKAEASAIVDGLKATEDVLKREKADATVAVAKALQETPEVVVNAYYLHAKKNRHAKKDVETMAGDMLGEQYRVDAEAFRNENAAHFRQKWFTGIIRAFLRLHAIGADAAAIQRELSGWSAPEFWRRWRSFETHMEFSIYDNRQHRKSLSTAHKSSIRAKRKIKEWMEDAAVDGRIRSDELTELLNRKFTRLRHTPALDEVEERMATFDEAKAERILRQLFDVPEVEHYHAHRVYHIQPATMPFTGDAPPWMAGEPVAYINVFVNSLK